MEVLSGILALDLSRGYPGSMATRFLADFGAEVIRIDAPTAVDPRRRGGRRAEGVSEERAAAFNPSQRNKRSMVLNLRLEEGRQVLYKLVRIADVLLEGNRPGVMKRLKADYETLMEINPRLIYCSTSGYGQDGPYSQIPGHDPNFIALAGNLSLIGSPDGPPVLTRAFLADFAGCGLHATIGLLLALTAREKTGRGQYIDVSYFEGAFSLAFSEVSSYLLTGQVPRRGQGSFDPYSPVINVFKCKDGEYVTVGNTEFHLWENFCRALGREDLTPCHTGAGASIEEGAKAWRAFRDIFLTRTRDEWWEYLKDKDVCVAPVYYINETLADPHVIHRRLVVEVDDPKLGRVRQPGMPIKLSETPGKIRSLGVKTGANTEEILGELGYSAEEKKRLREVGAIE